MLYRGSRLVEVGREWVGTRYHAGQAVKGQGADCCGFVLGVLAEAGIGDWRQMMLGRPRHVPKEFIRERCEQIALAWDEGEMEPGEVLYSLIQGTEEHLSIYAGGGRVLHASLRLSRCVAETDIALAGVVVARYRFAGVEYGGEA